MKKFVVVIIIYTKNVMTRPPLIINDKMAREMVENRKYVKKSPTLTKLTNIDREYLGGMFEVLKAQIEPNVSDEPIPNKTQEYRYTPKQMWENIKKYFEVSIEYGQPLTICGIGTFNGISRKQLFLMMNEKNLPKELFFLRDCAKFVEMYNEYAAHKKQNPAGPIFILKNFGWKDKFEIEATRAEGALTDEEREAAQKRIARFSEEGKIL